MDMSKLLECHIEKIPDLSEESTAIKIIERMDSLKRYDLISKLYKEYVLGFGKGE